MSFLIWYPVIFNPPLPSHSCFPNNTPQESQEESLSTYKESTQTVRKTHKKTYNKCPFRNVVTNLIKKLFSYMKRKNLLAQKFQLQKQQIYQFYEFLDKEKEKNHSYYNLIRYRKLLFQEKTDDDQKFRWLIRVLTKHFLNQTVINSIITSKKISKQNIHHNLKLVKKLQNILLLKQ